MVSTNQVDLDAAATDESQLGWLRHAILALEWITSGEEYWRPEYAKLKSERAASFGTNCLMFTVHHGGYTIYPSDTVPLMPRLEHDLLQDLITAARGRGMRVIAYWVATTPSAAS